MSELAFSPVGVRQTDGGLVRSGSQRANRTKIGLRHRRLERPNSNDRLYGENPLKNFDPEFRSIPDYIIKVTRRIWEDRGVGRIRDYYGDGVIVRTPMGLSLGTAPVIAATNATLHQFPDRRLLGEDVIWTGDDDAGVYYSSHRIVSPMTHRGHGMFGAPSGRTVKARTIADTVLRADRVIEEWLVRDHGAIVRQLGHDVGEFAARSIERELATGAEPAVFTQASDVPGAYRPPREDTEHARMYAATLEAIWRANGTAINERYDTAVALEHPGGIAASGKAQATKFWMALIAAVPDAAFSVDHLIGRDDPGYPLRAAARWTVSGTHSGAGAFGEASGSPIYIMGISHAEIVRGKIYREWVLLDELAIHRQIRLHKG